MNNPHIELGHDGFVGVGLRHPHYTEVMEQRGIIQFVEVHAENFYAEGGLALSLLHDVRANLDVSIHATSLGLGSLSNTPQSEIAKLKHLVDAINPIFVSDHAAFSWANSKGGLLHSGDLLPIAYNEKVLNPFSANVERVQQTLGRRLLIENVSSYLTWPDSSMQEFEFLQAVCERTGSGLLLDINNIYVNAVNTGTTTPLDDTKKIIDSIDPDRVEQIHLAGSTTPVKGMPLIDDHGTAVSEQVWQAYRHALVKIQPKPTLIEWDSNIPSWTTLIQQATEARQLIGDYHERH